MLLGLIGQSMLHHACDKVLVPCDVRLSWVIGPFLMQVDTVFESTA